MIRQHPSCRYMCLINFKMSTILQYFKKDTLPDPLSRKMPCSSIAAANCKVKAVM
uniref:Uncharacterized protein n=1 Tax=Amphimedon queenslandica TaxID=400682 RepID=A0A1X7V3V3_AMPQE